MPSRAVLPAIPLLDKSTMHRERLLSILQEARQKKLTLVAAPPGYGKTILVAQFATRTDLEVLWHIVDESERDAPTLATHVGDTFTKQLLPDHPLTQQAIDSHHTISATSILKSLEDSLLKHIFYVMDDVHHLIGHTDAEQWLRSFVQEAPPNLHLVLVGRALPPLPLLDLVTRGDVIALGQEQLRFSFEEVETFALQLGMPKTVSEVQQLIQRFDGWIAGTRLALQPLPPDIEAAIFSEGTGPEALFSNLAEQLFHQQTPMMQQFLLRSSTLTQITPVLCRNALKLTADQMYISEVLDHNLFALQVAGGITYHPLFRSFLQRRLQRQDNTLYHQLHYNTAKWFEEKNRLDEAFLHYVTAAEYQAAAAIAERAAQVYFAAGKQESILYWRDALDEQGTYTPLLHYTCAMIFVNRYQYQESADELRIALQQFESGADTTGVMKVRLLQIHVEFQQGHNRKAVEQVEELFREYELPLNLRANALFILGTAQAKLGEMQLALTNLEAALPLYRDIHDGFSLSQLLLSLEFAYTRIGRFDDGLESLKEAIEIRRSLDNMKSMVLPLNNLGWHYHVLGEYKLALETLREARRLGEQSSDKRAHGYVLWSLGDLLRDLGAFDDAEAAYQQGLRLIGDHEPELRVNLLLGQSTLERWRGDREASTEAARNAQMLANKHHFVFEQLQAELALLAAQTPHEPEGEIGEALMGLTGHFESQDAASQQILANIHYAWACLLAGKQREALKQVAESSRLAKHPTYWQPAAAEIVHNAQLYTFIDSHEQKKSSLLDAIRQLKEAQSLNRTLPPIPRQKPQRSTISLRIWGLGQEKVERDGVIVPRSAWRAKDARELFFYLLSNGSSTRDELGLLLWEDSSIEQMRLKFHSTLHRLRNAVGTNAVRFENDLYSLNPELDLWCDVAEFKSIVQEARLTSPLRAHTETLWQRALALSQGELFPEIDASWIIAEREALEQLHIEALLGLGACLRSRRDFRGAIETYQQAIAHDAYREETHRALITCYAELGEKTLALRQLERLKQVLNSELGIEPSAETVSLWEALRA